MDVVDGLALAIVGLAVALEAGRRWRRRRREQRAAAEAQSRRHLRAIAAAAETTASGITRGNGRPIHALRDPAGPTVRLTDRRAWRR
jgi:hypothetical protein